MKKFFKNKFLYVIAALLFLSPFATVPLCVSVLSGAQAVAASVGMVMGGWILGASTGAIQYSINGVEKIKQDPNYGDVRILSGEPVGYDDAQQLQAIASYNKKNKKVKVSEVVKEDENNSNFTL